MDYYVAVEGMSKLVDVCLAINLVLLFGLAYVIDIFVSDEIRRLKKARQGKSLLKNWMQRFHLVRFHDKPVIPTTHA